MKTVIPEEILETLRCIQCHEYLSCGPVYFVYKSDGALCGRCNLIETTTNSISSIDEEPSVKLNASEQKLFRYKEYEAAASLLLFPCKYGVYGCPEKLHFSINQPPSHEISCDYKQRACPILLMKKCEWMGPYAKLLEHCETRHSERIIQNPYYFHHDILQPSIKSYLVLAFNYLFVLYVKICTATHKIYYSMHLLGNPNKTSHFNYDIEIKRLNSKFTKHGDVIAASYFNFQEPTTVVINLNTLIDIFEGFEGTIFKVTIRQLIDDLAKQFCKFCKKPLNPSKNILICEECKLKLRACRYNVKGCLFSDINNDKCWKHEYYFCKFLTECLDCGHAIKQDKLFEHYANVHHAIETNIGDLWHMKEGYSQILILNNNSETIICKYSLACSRLLLSLYTPFSSDQLELYKCSIQIIDSNSNYTQTIIPENDYNYCMDWNININMYNFPFWQQDGLEIKIDITKIP